MIFHRCWQPTWRCLNGAGQELLLNQLFDYSIEQYAVFKVFVLLWKLSLYVEHMRERYFCAVYGGNTTVVKLASCAAKGVDKNKVKAMLRKIVFNFAIVSSFEAHGITRAVDTVMRDPYIVWVALMGPAQLCMRLWLFISCGGAVGKQIPHLI